MTLLRKTTIAVVLVFIEDAFIQSLSATTVMMLALYLHVIFCPFKDPDLNKVEFLSLSTTLVTQLMCLPVKILQSTVLHSGF